MPSEFKHAVLPNGLTIIAECDREAHTAAAGFFVRTGARDERHEVMGVSHFLEHMMFKGTDTLTADDINRGFDELGANNNAYTSAELTCFYAHLLPESLSPGLGLLGRMMRPALRQTDFDTEKSVILEEIAMYKDNPFWVLYEACVERHYAPHGLSHRVLGTTESITALQRDQMQSYFDNRYASDNTVLALAGRLDFQQIVDEAAALCGSWKPSGVDRSRRRPGPAGGRLELKDAKVNRAYMLAMCEGPSMDDDRKYAASLLAQVLGASDNSRLHWALIETGIAEEAQAAFDPHDGVGDYFVFAAGDPERADSIWEAIEKELSRLIDSVTEDDLVRLRNKAATAATLGGERPADRMQRLGRTWTYLGKQIPLEEELNRINRVTLDDLRSTFEAFPIKSTTMGRLMPSA